MIGIGMVSFAHLHAEGYAENLRDVKGVEVIGMVDEDRRRGAHFAERYRFPLFDSLDALLERRPDAVVICSENARHRAHVERAAQAGCHILCEKPLATSPADAEAMTAACKRAGVLLMPAHPMRFSEPLLQAKARLEGGSVGAIRCASGANCGQIPARHRDWFVDPGRAGGGAITDHIVHVADLYRWLFESEVAEVYAQANRIIKPDGGAVETSGMALLRFENGIFASIDASWNRPLHYPTWGGLTITLIGERETVEIDAFCQNTLFYANGGANGGTAGRSNRVRWDYWGEDINLRMIAHFVDAVRSGEEPRLTGRDGVESCRIIAAAYRSIASGEPARLCRQ